MRDDDKEFVECLKWLSERPEWGDLRYLFANKEQFLISYRNCMQEQI